MRFLLIGMALFLTQCRTTISGTIVSPEGRKLSSIKGKINVSPINPPGEPEILSISSNGEFETEREVIPGEYLIEPLIPGYQSTAIKVKVSNDRKVTLFAKPIASKRVQALDENRDFKEDVGQGGALIAPPKF